MITRDGKVAVVATDHNTHVERAGMAQYHFVVRTGGVSLAWVSEADFPAINGRKAGCCGRKYGEFRAATPEELAQWERAGAG